MYEGRRIFFNQGLPLITTMVDQSLLIEGMLVVLLFILLIVMDFNAMYFL